MAHPKRKISKTRRDKRRTHYKADSVTLTLDKLGEVHRMHRAYVSAEGDLIYRGQTVVENFA
jgi:large subunit ribosomal protein L32